MMMEHHHASNNGLNVMLGRATGIQPPSQQSSMLHQTGHRSGSVEYNNNTSNNNHSVNYDDGRTSSVPYNQMNTTSYKSPILSERKNNVNTSFRKAIQHATLKSNLTEESLRLRKFPVMEDQQNMQNRHQAVQKGFTISAGSQRAQQALDNLIISEYHSPQAQKPPAYLSPPIGKSLKLGSTSVLRHSFVNHGTRSPKGMKEAEEFKGNHNEKEVVGLPYPGSMGLRELNHIDPNPNEGRSFMPSHTVSAFNQGNNAKISETEEVTTMETKMEKLSFNANCEKNGVSHYEENDESEWIDIVEPQGNQNKQSVEKSQPDVVGKWAADISEPIQNSSKFQTRNDKPPEDDMYSSAGRNFRQEYQVKNDQDEINRDTLKRRQMNEPSRAEMTQSPKTATLGRSTRVPSKPQPQPPQQAGGTLQRWPGKQKLPNNVEKGGTIKASPSPAFAKDSSKRMEKFTRKAMSQILYSLHNDEKGEMSSTTTGLDLESLLDDQTAGSNDDDLSTTIDTTDAFAIRRQLESLESMYTEVLKVLGTQKGGGTVKKGPPPSGFGHLKRRYGSMSSLPSSVSSRPFREKRRIDDRKKGQDLKGINRRFQRLESHVVTLARSVAHLSSEMRTQHLMAQEMESIRNELSQLRSQLMHVTMMQNSSANNPQVVSSQNFGGFNRNSSHRADYNQAEWNTFKNGLPSLTNPYRVRKLTKFFGDEPPLIKIFLKKLGYEKYVPAFDAERIGILELPYLTEERLNKMGIPMGPRLRILQEAHNCLRTNNHHIFPKTDPSQHNHYNGHPGGNLSVYVV